MEEIETHSAESLKEEAVLGVYRESGGKEGAMEDAGSRRVQPLARPRSQLGALSGLIRASRGPRRPQRFSHQGA
ncbi:hypothetical protein Baya_9503 [Bagarius yarrelli]|uniref:Uncharacterized protein n=1 Tax=Bagarius yarrelli TaxID=175774 RepID=A0A556U983_BAGYA|nr:hypothetical protein Baya_9503 [Bagarius yarrelli]